MPDHEPSDGAQENKGHNSVDEVRHLLSELASSEAPIEQIRKLLHYPNNTLQKAFDAPGTKVIMLDLDGTLYDTDTAQKNGWVTAARQLELSVPEQDHLKLAVTAYDGNEVIERGLFHPHVNIRKIWNSDVHYAVMMFLDAKAAHLGNTDAAIGALKKALVGDDPESKKYQRELDRFIIDATGKGKLNERIKRAQAEFTRCCKNNIRAFTGVHESVNLLKKLGFVVVIATDGDRVTQVEKIYSWLKLGKFFQKTHILCTSDAPPQQEIEYLRIENAKLKERSASISEIGAQLESVKSDLLQRHPNKLRTDQIESLPTYRRLRRQTASTERDVRYIEFLRERLNRLTTKQRTDFYMTVIQAIASSPSDPLTGIGKPGLGHIKPVKICAVGDSKYDVGIHALDPNIIVVGVLTGKEKYRKEVEKELDPANPKLQNPARAKRAESLLAAMPFIVNSGIWGMVKPIHNIAQTAAPVVSDADTKLAMEIILSSKRPIARRIAARIVFEGSTFIKEAADPEAKEIIVQRFCSATNPIEQVYLARVLGCVASTNVEKKQFADVLTERLKHLSPIGARAALEALTYIGDRDHLQAVKTAEAESKYGIVIDAATQTKAALERNQIKYHDAEETVVGIVDSLKGITSMVRFYKSIGEIRALKDVYGIPLRREQAATIKDNYRRLKSAR
jgi:phosphoglycolate phosphatase-like HAD superfamily hydrolase